MILDWRRWGGALLAGCVTALVALEVPVRLPEGDATTDPANLLTEELPEVVHEDLDAFMASRRWGASLNEIREARVAEETEPEERTLNPVLVKMGYIGLIVAGDQSAVLLALPDGGVARMVPGDTLPDGRTLVSVTDNSLTLQGEGLREEVLMLFPRFRTGTKSWPGTSGDDTFEGGPEADSFDGGAGSDTVAYTRSEAGVTVALGSGEGRFGHASGDTFTGIEHIIGSTHDDTLYGDDGANRLAGGGGNDRIYAGGGDDILEGGPGADSLTGGHGEDTVSYAGSDAAVTVNLATGTGRFGHAEGDTLHGSEGNRIEHIIGSAHDDSLSGDSGDNRLDGGEGADLLDGGEGADELLGGAGSDTFIFASGHGDDTIADFTDGEDAIDLTGLGLTGFSDLAVSIDPKGVMIDLSAHGGGTILLERLDPAALGASDVLLH